jgi:8-oxo-dGTP pyrophosphatase MutT (NUDIX family)
MCSSRFDRRLDEATLREPLRRALATRAPRELPVGSGTAAAVLLPLFERDDEAYLWLVRRPETMRSHGGQVAFPGGKSDPADESRRATALREAEEELAIAPSSVDMLGALDDHPTITGFSVTPWVGWLVGDQKIEPNPSEVARAFAAPLRVFFGPTEGVPPYQGWTVDGEFVWGTTAAIMRGFVSIVRSLDERQ